MHWRAASTEDTVRLGIRWSGLFPLLFILGHCRPSSIALLMLKADNWNVNLITLYIVLHWPILFFSLASTHVVTLSVFCGIFFQAGVSLIKWPDQMKEAHCAARCWLCRFNSWGIISLDPNTDMLISNFCIADNYHVYYSKTRFSSFLFTLPIWFFGSSLSTTTILVGIL